MFEIIQNWKMLDLRFEGKSKEIMSRQIPDGERFEPRSHLKSRLRLIVRVNVVLNRTVVVVSD